MLWTSLNNVYVLWLMFTCQPQHFHILKSHSSSRGNETSMSLKLIIVSCNMEWFHFYTTNTVLFCKKTKKPQKLYIPHMSIILIIYWHLNVILTYKYQIPLYFFYWNSLYNNNIYIKKNNKIKGSILFLQQKLEYR